MSGRVVVTGVGVLSALGDTPAALLGGLVEGRSGLGPLSVAPADGLEECVVGEIADFDAARYLGDGNLRPLDRTSRLASAAAALALDGAGLRDGLRAAPERGDRIGLVLGTMFGSVRTIAEFDRRALTAGPSYVSPLDFANSVINAAAGHAAIWHGLRGVNATLAGGASAGAQALGFACEQLREGRAAALLAGGAEEVSFEGLLGAQGLRKTSARPRPFAADRDGVALGEGAALLVLEDAGHAAARGAAVRAEVLGHGVAYGAAGAGELALSTALGNAVRAALDAAGVAAAEVDVVSAGAGGDRLLDGAEARALSAVFGERAVPLLVTKHALGETLGAAAALQAVALLAAMEAGRLPGGGALAESAAALAPGWAPAARELALRVGLVTALDGDGQAAAVVLARPAGAAGA